MVDIPSSALSGRDDPEPPRSAAAIIDAFGLEPHPEGGWFRRTWTASSAHDASGRATASAIHYLLGADDRSEWHRLTDAEEVWIHQAGDPIHLHLSPDGQTEQVLVLGPPGEPRAVPNSTVPIGTWQSAEVQSAEGVHTATGWSLLTCVVSPEFRFEAFEMAPPCWSPGGDQV